MIYTRKENCGAYDRITTVTDSGEYEQIAVWPDGIVTSHYKITEVQQMEKKLFGVIDTISGVVDFRSICDTMEDAEERAKVMQYSHDFCIRRNKKSVNYAACEVVDAGLVGDLVGMHKVYSIKK